MSDPDAKVHHVPHPTNAPCPWLRKYIADKIDSGSEMPAKPYIVPEILQEVRQNSRAPLNMQWSCKIRSLRLQVILTGTPLPPFLEQEWEFYKR
jgi:hypothetical protein